MCCIYLFFYWYWVWTNIWILLHQLLKNSTSHKYKVTNGIMYATLCSASSFLLIDCECEWIKFLSKRSEDWYSMIKHFLFIICYSFCDKLFVKKKTKVCYVLKFSTISIEWPFYFALLKILERGLVKIFTLTIIDRSSSKHWLSTELARCIG